MVLNHFQRTAHVAISIGLSERNNQRTSTWEKNDLASIKNKSLPVLVRRTQLIECAEANQLEMMTHFDQFLDLSAH